MSRVSNHKSALLSEFKAVFNRVWAAAYQEGREHAVAVLGAPATRGNAPRRGSGRPNGSRNKPKTVMTSAKRSKNPWAKLTDEQREDRVRRILAGHGLRPKTAR